MENSSKKRILVTGGAGFIGGAFLNRMVPKYPQYEFINLDSLTPISNIQNVTVGAAPNYLFAKGDIRDKAMLDALFLEHGFTDVIHFAAETHVDVSIKEPQLFVETNVVGTSNLLSSAIAHGIDRFHHISTDEVYGELSLKDEPFTETTSLAPNSPYSASKAASDMLVRAFHKTYGLNTVTTRCSNNYGPGQDVTKFIPRAITTLLEGGNIPVYGEGAQIRDWLYVEDHVEAIDLVFHTGIKGEVYNVGGGTEMPNIDIARILCEKVGRQGAIEFVEDRKGHDYRYAINDTKIRALGYEPRTTFEEGLEKTLTWYKAIQ